MYTQELRSPLLQEFYYRTKDGALLEGCVNPDDPSLKKKTSIPPIKGMEIGQWPFYKEDEKRWIIRDGVTVSPSYKIILMFHPSLNYAGRPLILPSYLEHSLKKAVFASTLFSQLCVKVNFVNEAMRIWEELCSLNSELGTNYERFKFLSPGIIDPTILNERKKAERRFISDIRRLLTDLVLPSLLNSQNKSLKKEAESKKDISFLFDKKFSSQIHNFPIINKYFLLFLLVQDIDNANKHELSRGETGKYLCNFGISIAKVNNPGHYRRWRLRQCKSPWVCYETQQLWFYEVEVRALVVYFSRFLCEFLGISDGKTEAEPPIFFQITGNWTLSDMLSN